MLDEKQIERLMIELRAFYTEVPNFEFQNAWVQLSSGLKGAGKATKLRLRKKSDLANLIQLLKFIRQNDSFKMTKYF